MLAAFLAFLLVGSTSQPLRVGMLSLLSPTRVEIVSRTAAIPLPNGGSLAPGGCLVVRLDNGRRMIANAPSWSWRGKSLTVGSAGTELDVKVIGRESRERVVDGPLTFEISRGVLAIVATVEIERIVATAVASELDEITEPAALEAASVVIRSYLATSRGRHASEGFDVCDTTHCLVSRGAKTPATESGRAAGHASTQTIGRVLQHGGGVVPAFFSACCGGQTTTPASLWGGPDSGAFTAVACPYCAKSSYFAWSRRLDTADVRRTLGELLGGPHGQVDLIALDHDPRGYVRALRVSSGASRSRIDGERFRLALGRKLGWDAIPSARYTLERIPGGYRLVGSGHGHGIGLCIAGAVEMARIGKTRDEILAFYFPRYREVSNW